MKPRSATSKHAETTEPTVSHGATEQRSNGDKTETARATSGRRSRPPAIGPRCGLVARGRSLLRFVSASSLLYVSRCLRRLRQPGRRR
jgi:hypothetical protein